MPNINLATEDVVRRSSTSTNKGLIFSIALLIFIFVLYGVFLIANKVISSKIEMTKNEYGVEYNKFLEGEGNEIIDFKNRSDEAEKIIIGDRSMADVLGQIEKSMLPVVYVNSLKYDKNKQTVSLICIGDNFQTVAKQVLSFKQNEYFSAVVPGQSTLDPKENNKISFNIELKIK